VVNLKLKDISVELAGLVEAFESLLVLEETYKIRIIDLNLLESDRKKVDQHTQDMIDIVSSSMNGGTVIKIYGLDSKNDNKEVEMKTEPVCYNCRIVVEEAKGTGQIKKSMWQ